MKLRKQLIGDRDLIADDVGRDAISLQRYEKQKKQEEERRLRNIELQKKAIAGKLDAEIKD